LKRELKYISDRLDGVVASPELLIINIPDALGLTSLK